MPIVIAGVFLWLTKGWWLLGLAAVLGWAHWLGLRGWKLLALGVILWLAVAAGVHHAPASRFAWAVQWSANGMIWMLVIGLMALGAGQMLAFLHRRNAAPGHDAPGLVPLRRPAPAVAPGGPVSDPELDRYARHIILREIGGPGQAALKRAKVLVVGAGGLGAPVCLYLAAAGVGRITVADDDRVSLSNLQRQVIFRSSDDGRPKADAARDAMRALNPLVEITPLNRRVTEADTALIAGHDLVIDGSDSFASRQAVNVACARAGVPLVAGAIAQWEGQLTVWDPARGAPCMACLFPEAPAQGLAPACAEAGVVGPLPGVIGSMMALEAIKLIAGAGEPLRGRMLIFDGLYSENRLMKISRRADCPVCGSGHLPPG
ncbi:molybdopterin-synthase adenylyltransferase MoeB [Paracoccus sp. N5]|uniref:HesA/MoeB/ThiF family protein n=1 Tax=Paracoccus sp. N5 TaxID=1101189 RepID=UPI0003640331|nr:molybdopterin-synthase adenylyltransferase MoeB [Paracoccus sp. N5]